MQNKMLSIFLGGMVVAIGLCVAPAVHAEEALPDHDQLSSEITSDTNSDINNVLIINTGDDAQVDASTTQNTDTTVDNNNDATVNQEVNAVANTGGNEASRNISFGGDAGSIATGDATVVTGMEATANSNQTAVAGTCPALPGSNGEITNTGDDLEVDINNSVNCSTTVISSNNATIIQTVNAVANTGDNEAERNIAIGGGSAGSITTGNATVATVLVTRANDNVVLVGGESGQGGPGSGANIYIINTGDDLDYDGRRRNNYSVEVSNHNEADIDQLVNIAVDTGHNDSSRNINTNGDAGVIVTGDAVVVTEISATANSNTTAVGGTNGSMAGDASVEVINTGDDLDVDVSSESNTEIEVDNHNDANVDQEVNVVANTGYNTANRNIAFGGDAGSITTGDATVMTMLEVDVNSNTTLITGLGNGSNSGDTNLDLVNTGDDVEVDVSTETSTEIEVDNHNEAEIHQQVNVAANTGNNTASNNIGGTSMTTGNVTITTEIITNANNNYTFIVDSGVNGFELFKLFVTTFLGLSWEDLIGGSSASAGGDTNLSVVNTGDNANILAENTQTRTVIVNNNNKANVNQAVNVAANTGNNTCNANVGDCRITTGDATIWTRLIANVNNNFTFIGNVQLPKPEVPEEPETPVTPEQPEQPEEVDRPQPQVLGDSVERPQAVLAAVTLPMTGGLNLALLGLALIGSGLSLRLKKANA